MTGQHWDEIARSICKTKGLSIWGLCRLLEITPQHYYNYARKGMSYKVRIKMMGKLRKIMVVEAYGI
jgi:hypothetical protein